MEERIAILEEKILKKKAELSKLEKQKSNLLHPVTMRSVISKAKEAGLTLEDVADKLGLELE